MANGTQETEILAGDIFFQVGNYRKKINVKTAGGTAFTEETISLPAYTENETWQYPAVQYGITGIDFTTGISSVKIEIEYLNANKNVFKFVGYVNGQRITNQIQVSWYAWEEVIDIGGEKATSIESKNRNQVFTHTLKVKPYQLLGVSVNTGNVSYTQPDANLNMTFTCNNGNPYKQYPRYVIRYVNGKPGSYVAPNTMYVTETAFYNQFLGNLDFAGNISKTSETKVQGAWTYGTEYKWKSSVRENYTAGTLINKTETLDLITEDRVTRSVYIKTVNYVAYYDVYAKKQQAVITKNITYEGNIYAPTYLYIVTIKYISK